MIYECQQCGIEVITEGEEEDPRLQKVCLCTAEIVPKPDPIILRDVDAGV